MHQTLSEIVNQALRQADASVKVASLRDAPIEDRSFARVDQYLAQELGQIPVAEAQKKAAKALPRTKFASGGMDDVQYALKLAQALNHGAAAMQKLAGPAGGNVPVPEQPFANTPVKVPVPQASAHARRAQANAHLDHDGYPDTDAGLPSKEGPVIPAGYRGKDKMAHREECIRTLRSKKAQHDMLLAMGQVESANNVLKEAGEIENFLKTDDQLGTHFPDNEGVRNLTKAQARDANQRQAGQFFGEPVKRDNAVAAHTLTTHGLKLSAAQRAIAKLAAKAPSKGVLKRVLKDARKTRAKNDHQSGLHMSRRAAGGAAAAIGGTSAGAGYAVGQRKKASLGLFSKKADPSFAQASGRGKHAFDATVLKQLGKAVGGKTHAQRAHKAKGIVKRTKQLFSGERLDGLRGIAKERSRKGPTEGLKKRITSERRKVIATRAGAGAAGVGAAGATARAIKGKRERSKKAGLPPRWQSSQVGKKLLNAAKGEAQAASDKGTEAARRASEAFRNRPSLAQGSVRPKKAGLGDAMGSIGKSVIGAGRSLFGSGGKAVAKGAKKARQGAKVPKSWFDTAAGQKTVGGAVTGAAGLGTLAVGNRLANG